MSGSQPRGKWLHLPVEWRIRELPAKLLLAGFAAARGYHVTIGDQKLYRRNWHRLPRGIILRKSFIPEQLAEILRCKELGQLNIGCDEETFTWYCAEGVSALCRMRSNRETVAAVDRIFVWGERMGEILGERYPEAPAKIAVTGTPRLDLYRPEFRHVYRKDADRYVERYGRFILLNSNFARATLFDTPQDYADNFIARDPEIGGQVADKAAALHEFTQRALARFTEALPRVRAAFPDHAIVVRPHPADRIDRIGGIASGIDNCHVVLEDHVAPWLLAAEAVFHHGCSTGVEAWMLGTPTVAYHPDHDERFTEIGGMFGAEAATVDELVDALGQLIGKRDAQRDGHDWASHYFAGIEGRTASELTVDALDAMGAEEAPSEYDKLPPWGGLSGAKRLEAQLRYVRNRHLARPPKTMRGGSSWKTHRKWPQGLTLDSLRSTLDGYAVGNAAFKDLALAQLDDQLFRISMR